MSFWDIKTPNSRSSDKSREKSSQNSFWEMETPLHAKPIEFRSEMKGVYPFTQTEKNIGEFARAVPESFTTASLGTYGNLLDLVGLQSKTRVTPGQQELYREQEEILDRMNAGETPSLADLMTLTGDEQSAMRLPSSEEARNLLELLGHESFQPETAGGRAGQRVGSFLGTSAAMAPFGGASPKADVLAGLAGQAVEEAGGGPLAQMGAETVPYLFGKRVPSSAVASRSKQAQPVLETLTKEGFPKEAINLAKGALEEHPVLKKVGKITTPAEKALQSYSESAVRTYQDMLSNAFPGLEHGLEQMEAKAGEVYKTLQKNPFTVKNPNAVKAELTDYIKHHFAYEPTLRDGLLQKMEGWKKGKGAFPKAEVSSNDLIDLIQDVNAHGDWTQPSKKTARLDQFKERIKDIFRQEGPSQKAFLEEYNNANKAYSIFQKAKQATKIFEPAFLDGKVDYKKLEGILKNQKNLGKLAQSIPAARLRTLREIAATGNEIGNLEKALASQSSFATNADRAKMMGLAFALGSMDVAIIAKSLAGYAGVEATKEMTQRIATRLLIDPEYQNLVKRSLHAIKSGTGTALPKIAQDAQKLFEKDQESD